MIISRYLQGVPKTHAEMVELAANAPEIRLAGTQPEVLHLITLDESAKPTPWFSRNGGESWTAETFS